MSPHVRRFVLEVLPAILAADPQCVRRGIAAEYAQEVLMDHRSAVGVLMGLTAGSHAWGSPWPAWAAQVAHGCLSVADPDAYLAARLVEAEAHLSRDGRHTAEPIEAALITGMMAVWASGLPVPGLPVLSVEAAS